VSRREGIKLDIDSLIDGYKASKDKENALKKSNADVSAAIKSYFMENGIDKHSTDFYTATLSCTKNESLNEDLAIEIIKENLGGALLSSVIKQKEYIDDDALEKLVYNGDFDITKLAKAKMVKETYTLRISKNKDD
jgi:hypothetical protein